MANEQGDGTFPSPLFFSGARDLLIYNPIKHAGQILQQGFYGAIDGGNQRNGVSDAIFGVVPGGNNGP